MLEPHRDVTNALRQFAQPPAEVEVPPPQPALVWVILTSFGVVVASIGGLTGVVGLFLHAVWGAVIILVSGLAGFTCYYLTDDMQAQRKRHRKWVDEHGGNELDTYSRIRKARIEQLSIDAQNRALQYSRMPPDAATAAVQGMTQIALQENQLPYQDRQHQRQLQHDADMKEKDNATQIRVTEIQSSAEVKKTFYSSLAQMGQIEREKSLIKFQHDLETAEAQRVREWQSAESEKDRQLALSRIMTEMQGKIELLEARMNWESPSAEAESQEEMVRLKGDMAKLEHIMNEIKDPVVRKQMMDRFIKDRFKRGR